MFLVLLIRGHTLDLFFSFGLNFEELSVVHVHVSDHCCVYFNLSFIPGSCSYKMISQRRIINQTAVEIFSELFECDFVYSCDDADYFAHSLNSHCLSVLNGAAPVRYKISFLKACAQG